MAKRNWLVRGYRSLEKIYEVELPLGCLSEREMVGLLQRLCCKHLSADEIVAATMRKNSNKYAEHLEPNKEAKANNFSISVGLNP